MKMITLPALLLLGLAGCQLAPQGQPLVLQGSLFYPERIALPPDSVARVTLKRFDATGGQVVATQEIPLQGRQVPVPFSLEATALPAEAAVYELRGSVTLGAEPFRITRPVMVDPGAGTVDLGMLRLLPVEQVALGTHYVCGAEELLFSAEGETARMAIQGRVVDMKQARAASGVLYRALGDETTFFHGKGNEAVVEIEGRGLPTCRRAEAPAVPFRARGQEPPWTVSLAPGEAEILLGYDQRRAVMPLLTATTEGRVTRFRAAGSGHRLAMDVARRNCNDSMSGMPHPYIVAVEFDGQVFTGCGGEPVDLLAGREWVVEDLDGGGIIDRSRVTLVFDAAERRVHGRASCNTYTGGFVLTGEGLSFGNVAATRMACPEALMNQERKFFRILEGVNRFDIDATGALLLFGGNGTMKAYPTSPPPGAAPPQ
ncbi:META domain-containing protein [Thioalkalivibrio sp. XN8]|uniref:META domain-containing protein n=1 Tax=Thioalkalivibrio sp. XN8 TaxID=2712863 RepID=UPI0013EE2B14|nr:META domain-containing protein [Thioalkalivibrio sp. XN8]NGP52900.1 META domain-containing protein [Thioalkalivibrio sp. XN8]